MSSLKYVIVVPAGGGKTILSLAYKKFLDADFFYHLRETNSTYTRIGHECQEGVFRRQSIPLSISNKCFNRNASYHGDVVCLLVQSIGMAVQSSLGLVAVSVPQKELHERAIATRYNTAKWSGRANVDRILEEAERTNITVTRYDTWLELERIQVLMLYESLEREMERPDIRTV